MKRFKRSDRVGELLRREISVIIDNELRDAPNTMITVTGLNMSNDLMNARVFVSIMGDDDAVRKVVDYLNEKSGYMRGLIAGRILLRCVPELSFQYDTSTVTGMHMDKLFEDIRKQRENV